MKRDGMASTCIHEAILLLQEIVYTASDIIGLTPKRGLKEEAADLSLDCTHRLYPSLSFRLGIDQIRQCSECTRVDLDNLLNQRPSHPHRQRHTASHSCPGSSSSISSHSALTFSPTLLASLLGIVILTLILTRRIGKTSLSLNFLINSNACAFAGLSVFTENPTSPNAFSIIPTVCLRAGVTDGSTVISDTRVAISRDSD
jgi:hypothetical protein